MRSGVNLTDGTRYGLQGLDLLQSVPFLIISLLYECLRLENGHPWLGTEHDHVTSLSPVLLHLVHR